jgi:16S rRNA (uracil1498-N3)-methyltransferase
MPQFFIDQPFEPGSIVTIRGADARHILKSLRLQVSDWMRLSDGRGRTFRAVITETHGSTVHVRIEEEIVRSKGRLPPALAIALASRERVEWAVQKVVELGCRRILPFASERTALAAADAAHRHARLASIALEAAKQSGLPFEPCVEAPRSFTDLCSASTSFAPSILLYEGERARSLKELLPPLATASSSNEALLIVGPEGGFAEEEVTTLTAANAVSASLGDQILRVETAAIAAFTLLQYELGNLEIH